jgi:uncharacterized protein (TIGR03067 family)
MMYRFALAAAFASFTLALALADDKADMKALSGKWAVSEATIDGKSVTESFKTADLTIENGNYTVKFGDMIDKGTITVDSSKKPKSMDVTGAEGQNREKTYPCIYEIKDDTLTICYGLDFKTRPNEMKTSEKSERLLIVYKKKK